jgi:hypothetical protein
MSFLRDLFFWFLHGTWPKRAPSGADEPAEAVSREIAPEMKEEEDIFSIRPMGFLEELRSIRPMSKAFDQDRSDLINELRKLAPKKRNPLR